ncbi:UNKNOWN [Stylonychia lemnae]|uniref:Uncharacterized protein n=1 Tax=Stylonychia lemnae TaxID=5949 RepID=A0A078AEA9_STYLE|nr:UNKNOWN [Stylonychia lemnae]|eukprot:CDW80535.1 UNKNOWN [Stylonychia lemnae]
MGHNFKALRHNFNQYFNVFYDYFLRAIYWGSVPAIVLYGLLSKPYSPLLLAMWAQLTGAEEQQDMYGMPPQGGAPGYY